MRDQIQMSESVASSGLEQDPLGPQDLEEVVVSRVHLRSDDDRLRDGIRSHMVSVVRELQKSGSIDFSSQLPESTVDGRPDDVDGSVIASLKIPVPEAGQLQRAAAPSAGSASPRVRFADEAASMQEAESVVSAILETEETDDEQPRRPKTKREETKTEVNEDEMYQKYPVAEKWTKLQLLSYLENDPGPEVMNLWKLEDLSTLASYTVLYQRVPLHAPFFDVVVQEFHRMWIIYYGRHLRGGREEDLVIEASPISRQSQLVSADLCGARLGSVDIGLRGRLLDRLSEPSGFSYPEVLPVLWSPLMGISDPLTDAYRTRPACLCEECVALVQESETISLDPEYLRKVTRDYRANRERADREMAGGERTAFDHLARLRESLERMDMSMADWMVQKGFVVTQEKLARVMDSGSSDSKGSGRRSSMQVSDIATHQSMNGGNFCVPWVWVESFLRFMAFVLSKRNPEPMYLSEKYGVGHTHRGRKNVVRRLCFDLDILQPWNQPVDATLLYRIGLAIQLAVQRFYPNMDPTFRRRLLRMHLLLARPKTKDRGYDVSLNFLSKEALFAKRARTDATDRSPSPTEKVSMTMNEPGPGHLEYAIMASSKETYQILPREPPEVPTLTMESLPSDRSPFLQQGVHVIFPYLTVDTTRASWIRETVVCELERLLGTRDPPRNPWHDLVDPAVISNTGLRMPRHDKPVDCKLCKEWPNAIKRTCPKCLGRGRYPEGRVYTTNYVLDGPEGGDEAFLLGVKTRLQACEPSDWYRAVSKLSGETRTCSLCSKSPNVGEFPESIQAWAKIREEVLRHLNRRRNWSEEFACKNNIYYELKTGTARVPNNCPSSPGFSIYEGAPRPARILGRANALQHKMATGRALDTDDPYVDGETLAREREDFRKLNAAFGAIASRMEERERAAESKHFTEEQQREYERNRLEWKHAVQEYFENLPDKQFADLYGRLTVYDVRGPIMHKDILFNESDSYSSLTTPMFKVRVRGENCRYCTRVNRCHQSNSICFLICRTGMVQICFSQKNLSGEAASASNCCCANVGGTNVHLYSSRLIPLTPALTSAMFSRQVEQETRQEAKRTVAAAVNDIGKMADALITLTSNTAPPKQEVSANQMRSIIAPRTVMRFQPK